MKNKSEHKKTGKTSRKMTSKHLVALAGVALLVIMYIATLIVAIVDNTSSGQWFRICLFATVAIPLLIWIYTWMYGRLTGRHTIADPDSGVTPKADIPPEAGTARHTDAASNDGDRH